MAKINWTFIVFILLVGMVLGGCGTSSDRQLAEKLDLGVKYLSMMEYERAADAYLDAVEIEPKCVEAYFGLAVVYYETGEVEKAGAVLQQAEIDVGEVFRYSLTPSDDGRGEMEIAGLLDMSLKAVVIPEKIDEYPVKKISFSDCKNLTYVMIPDSVTEVGSGAFSDCESLAKVIIPDSVTSIGDNAFKGCKNLISVAIPDSVTEIGVAAFSDCKSLTSFTIPDGVTEMDNTFWNCESLTSVMIPESVAWIKPGVFNGCRSLKTIHTPQGSAAERWAQENGYEVVNIMP